ncbi:MAG: hypothetical protein Rubg2KO_12470 [Rubricoccaceae bacterium]
MFLTESKGDFTCDSVKPIIESAYRNGYGNDYTDIDTAWRFVIEKYRGSMLGGWDFDRESVDPLVVVLVGSSFVADCPDSGYVRYASMSLLRNCLEIVAELDLCDRSRLAIENVKFLADKAPAKCMGMIFTLG